MCVVTSSLSVLNLSLMKYFIFNIQGAQCPWTMEYPEDFSFLGSALSELTEGDELTTLGKNPLSSSWFGFLYYSERKAGGKGMANVTCHYVSLWHKLLTFIILLLPSGSWALVGVSYFPVSILPLKRNHPFSHCKSKDQRLYESFKYHRTRSGWVNNRKDLKENPNKLSSLQLCSSCPKLQSLCFSGEALKSFPTPTEIKLRLQPNYAPVPMNPISYFLPFAFDSKSAKESLNSNSGTVRMTWLLYIRKLQRNVGFSDRHLTLHSCQIPNRVNPKTSHIWWVSDFQFKGAVNSVYWKS